MSVPYFVLMVYRAWYPIKTLPRSVHIKVENFRPSTAQVKFHQICTLIDSFCWKYVKFQLKKYRGVMSHETEE